MDCWVLCHVGYLIFRARDSRGPCDLMRLDPEQQQSGGGGPSSATSRKVEERKIIRIIKRWSRPLTGIWSFSYSTMQSHGCVCVDKSSHNVVICEYVYVSLPFFFLGRLYIAGGIPNWIGPSRGWLAWSGWGGHWIDIDIESILWWWSIKSWKSNPCIWSPIDGVNRFRVLGARILATMTDGCDKSLLRSMGPHR